MEDPIVPFRFNAAQKQQQQKQQPHPATTRPASTAESPESPSSPASPSEGTNGKRKKIHRSKNACVACHKARARCDSGKPCGRCLRLGHGDRCEPFLGKKRGRKPLLEPTEPKHAHPHSHDHAQQPHIHPHAHAHAHAQQSQSQPQPQPQTQAHATSSQTVPALSQHSTPTSPSSASPASPITPTASYSASPPLTFAQPQFMPQLLSTQSIRTPNAHQAAAFRKLSSPELSTLTWKKAEKGREAPLQIEYDEGFQSNGSSSDFQESMDFPPFEPFSFAGAETDFLDFPTPPSFSDALVPVSRSELFSKTNGRPTIPPSFCLRKDKATNKPIYLCSATLSFADLLQIPHREIEGAPYKNFIPRSMFKNCLMSWFHKYSEEKTKGHPVAKFTLHSILKGGFSLIPVEMTNFIAEDTNGEVVMIRVDVRELSTQEALAVGLPVFDTNLDDSAPNADGDTTMNCGMNC